MRLVWTTGSTSTIAHCLLGKYKTPRLKYGDSVVCGVRSEVVITGMVWPPPSPFD